ncbi:MAG: prepilin-type N-terminal cleavage/methylation domain-containing protein [Myxococcus sp.]|nr:prepilin-type N-terminal cleavage/methylation domain-containing protein [Myxococcus sp.]
MRTRRTGTGFTLVELMVVVAIIGILAAISIPNFIKFQAKGKQAEASAQLKAIFSAQKATVSLNGGYWSDIGAIGFSPERGNRYLYDLGATAPTVNAGTQANCALANLQSRAGALIVMTTGDCGVGVDSARYGTAFLDATISALPIAGMVSFLPENTNAALAADMTGVTGAACPNCDFAARAKSNIDNDSTGDEWWISSQTIETAAVPGCAAAMSIATMNAFPSGGPALVSDDVCSQ